MSPKAREGILISSPALVRRRGVRALPAPLRRRLVAHLAVPHAFPVPGSLASDTSSPKSGGPRCSRATRGCWSPAASPSSTSTSFLSLGTARFLPALAASLDASTYHRMTPPLFQKPLRHPRTLHTADYPPSPRLPADGGSAVRRACHGLGLAVVASRLPVAAGRQRRDSHGLARLGPRASTSGSQQGIPRRPIELQLEQSGPCAQQGGREEMSDGGGVDAADAGGAGLPRRQVSGLFGVPVSRECAHLGPAHDLISLAHARPRSRSCSCSCCWLPAAQPAC